MDFFPCFRFDLARNKFGSFTDFNYNYFKFKLILQSNQLKREENNKVKPKTHFFFSSNVCIILSEMSTKGYDKVKCSLINIQMNYVPNNKKYSER